MNQGSYKRIPILFTSLLYACGFFIFLEWLYPIKQITDTNNMKIFIIYAVFCFVISLFQIIWWNSLLLKGLGMLFFIDRKSTRLNSSHVSISYVVFYLKNLYI